MARGAGPGCDDCQNWSARLCRLAWHRQSASCKAPARFSAMEALLARAVTSATCLLWNFGAAEAGVWGLRYLQESF